jgi:hypothetical protein
MNIKSIVAEAVKKAKDASIAKYDEMGRKDAYACGFAWVDVYVSRTNSKEAKELIAAGFKKDYKPRCLSMWNPGDLPVQNIDIKEAGAYAMADYLREQGLEAYASSRLD